MPVETVPGMFYNIAANYHRLNQDLGEGMQLCQSGLALAISIASTKWQSLALYMAAHIKKDFGDFSGAMEDASKSQRMAKIAGNPYQEACALCIGAVSWRWLGNYSHSISLLDRATHLMNLCGMSGGILHGTIRISQAEIHRLKSQYVDARSIQTHILQDNTADQNPYHHALALLNIAQIDVEIRGAQYDVQQKINTAVTLFQGLKYPNGMTYCDAVRAAVNVQTGKFTTARNLFQKCLQSTWRNDSEVVMYCLEKLASVQHWDAADRISSPWPVTFLAHSVKFGQKPELYKALQFLGDVFQAQGDQETAISLFAVALDGFTQMDVHRSRAECMVRLGDISNLNGNPLEAVKFWETARPLFERSSQGKQLADLNSKLSSLSCNQSQEFQQVTVDHLSELPPATQ
jgi:tetratricopeptide (TPR) repeat protein